MALPGSSFRMSMLHLRASLNFDSCCATKGLGGDGLRVGKLHLHAQHQLRLHLVGIRWHWPGRRRCSSNRRRDDFLRNDRDCLSGLGQSPRTRRPRCRRRRLCGAACRLFHGRVKSCKERGGKSVADEFQLVAKLSAIFALKSPLLVWSLALVRGMGGGGGVGGGLPQPTGEGCRMMIPVDFWICKI
jgi:hypothetical protein